MDVERLIQRAQQGDLEAFAEVTRRFQHMAFGYALALLRDLQQAEDVVQEAFVAAWFGLRTLADPAAFPGWFRGIVRHRAHRVLRQRRHVSLPLEAALTVPANGTGPDGRLEEQERIAAVLGAIAGLPSSVREVTTLFYVHDCTQQDIATFLGLPVTTVNNRLHTARQLLKRGTLTMVKDTLEAHRLPDDFAARIGRIVRAREGVVEVIFDPTNLPDPLTDLTVSDTPRRRAVTVQVVQLLEGGVVRCVPLSPTEGLTAGMTVPSAGRRIEAPAGREAVDRAVRLLAGPVREPDRAPETLETGIKVIDVMCPLVRGGRSRSPASSRPGPPSWWRSLPPAQPGAGRRLDLRLHSPIRRPRARVPGNVGEGGPHRGDCRHGPDVLLPRPGGVDGRAPRDPPLGGCGHPPVEGPRADRHLSHDRPPRLPVSPPGHGPRGSGARGDRRESAGCDRGHRGDEAARPQGPAVLRPALLRGRGVHASSRRHRGPGRDRPDLPGHSRRGTRSTPRAGVLLHRRDGSGPREGRRLHSGSTP